MKTVKINHPSTFSTGVRVISLVYRNKDGVAAAKPKSKVKVSYRSGEYDDIVTDLIATGEASGSPFRIYATVAPRSEKKAIRLFKQHQLDSDYDQNPAFFYRRLETKWASCLRSEKSSEHNLWLFDCDTAEEKQKVKTLINDHYNRQFEPYEYATKNGSHIVTEPFNTKGFAESDVLKKSADILVAYTTE